MCGSVPQVVQVAAARQRTTRSHTLLAHRGQLLTTSGLPTLPSVASSICSNLASAYGDAVKGMLPVLDGYAWSYEAGAVKPAPAIYQYVLDQLGCSAQEVLFIGDTPVDDVDGPRAFGMSADSLTGKLASRWKRSSQICCSEGCPPIIRESFS